MRGGKLCTNMRAEDVTSTIELALQASGCDQTVVRHKPRLLSDNGSCYISGDLATWLAFWFGLTLISIDLTRVFPWTCRPPGNALR